MSREVLQMALDVLKGCLEHPDAQDSIIAIEHELAQPEHPEQMARLGWQYFKCPACESDGARAFPKPEQYSDIISDGGLDPRNKFDAQQEQEPVAWMDEDGDVLSASIVDGKGLRNIPLYASPPQREWVGLTEEEREECVGEYYRGSIASAIEAKLKEKNT